MTGVARDALVDQRYRVLHRLGSGGMADVYLAVDEQLGRKVALKLLHPRYSEDHEFVERFRREASNAAGLQHPNVVGIFDRGSWDGTYYIAMEYVEGRSLKQLVREEGPLDPDRAADLVLQVLKALRFAHRNGVVHRDIKPHNVIVDAEGRAKVTDFGIARAGASDMTQTGSIMGTAQYLSPEQAQGHHVDARSDLYSVGIVLYELLTGRVPFEGDSPVTVALKQVAEQPPAPSRLNPRIGPALENVVLRALQKDPARRFASADEFIAALEHARTGPPPVERIATTGSYPLAAPLAPEELEERDRSARRWLLPLGVLLALAALAAGAFFLLRADTRRVPTVVGERQGSATRILQNRGFEVDVEPQTSRSVARDRVIRQDPAPREEAREGSTVVIVVSAGPGERTIPAVAGDTRREAEAKLEQVGFKVRVSQEFSNQVQAGRVLRTNPPERSLLVRGRTVTLVVSQGAEPVVVPDVLGQQRAPAQRALERAGLEVTVRTRESTDAGPGTVLDQSPAGGTEVAPGGSVTLVVAAAPERVAVPDVTGRSVNAALAQLQDAGFEVREDSEDVADPEQDGQVVDQRPADGERREPGSRVTIVVGRYVGTDAEADPGADPGAAPEATPDATP